MFCESILSLSFNFLIRCLVHYILDSYSMYYFHKNEYGLLRWSYSFEKKVFMQHMLRMGIDVGSTTVKVVLLDEHDNYLYKKYIRHYANILDTIIYLVPRGSSWS